VAGLRWVWPIHFQQCCWSTAISGFCLFAATVLCCWCSQAIVFGGLLMNVWIFVVVFTVGLQVSAPYSSIDFTLVLNSLI
jgi:hypothetical protein